MKKLIVIDLSTSALSFRKSRRLVSKVLHRITTRIHVGQLPGRVTAQLVAKLREAASKSSCLIVLIENSVKPTGWDICKIGNSKSNSKLYDFDPGLRKEILNMSLQLVNIISKNERRSSD